MSELPLDASLIGLLTLPCEDCTAAVRTSEALERLRELAASRPFGFLLGEHRRLCRTCAAVQTSIDCERQQHERARRCVRELEREQIRAKSLTLVSCGKRAGKTAAMRVWVGGRLVVGVDPAD